MTTLTNTVLITGGNKGIGLAATEKFLNAGNTVIVVARDFSDFKFKGHKEVKTIVLRDVKERGRNFDGVINQYLEDVRPSFFKYIDSHKEKAHFNYNEKNKVELFNKLKDIL